MRVVILGAGASHGASQNHGLACPLVDGVFKTASFLGLTNATYADDWQRRFEEDVRAAGGDPRRIERLHAGRTMVHLGAIKGFVKQQLLVAPEDYPTVAIDLERVMGLVEGEVLGYHELLNTQGGQPELLASPADVLEQQLYLLLCGSLIATTKDISCSHHESLAQWLRRGDIVVSFNYDLLIDRALGRRGDWAMNDGYNIEFTRIGRRLDDHAEWRAPLETESAIKLFKLHGSLNWLYCRDPWHQHNRDLHGAIPRRASQAIYCLDDIHGNFVEDHPLYEWWARYEHDEDDYTFDLHSLILPPSSTKPYRSMEQFIGHLWGTVLRHLLLDAAEIYFVGYSMRELDLRSWWLFRKAADEASALQTVHVIDPSDSVYERIKGVFWQHDVRRAAGSLGEFGATLA